MKSKLIKTICLIVALVMFCSSFASCKKTSQSGGKKPTSSASASEGNDSLPDSNEMNSDVISGLDIDSLSSGVDITLEDIESQYTDTSEESEHSDTSQLVEDPLFDDSAEEETDDEDIENEDIEDDPLDLDDIYDWLDIEDLVEQEYVSPIQMVGTAVDDNNPKRKISIETNNIVFKNFLSIGGNVFPGLMSNEGRQGSGMNDVYFEVERKRFVSAKPQLNRLLFPVDYMVTNTGNEEQDGWNYNNGIYDFENDKAQAAYKYIEMIDSYGGLVELNYGWKAAERIQSWFSLSDTNPTGSAPYDLRGYSNACAALVKYLLVDKEYTNIHALCFFNEMGHEGYDFDTLGDRMAYYVAMLRFVKEGLDKYGLFDDIEIWVCEDGFRDESAEVMQKHWGENISGYSFHEYAHAYGEGYFYTGIFNKICEVYSYIKKPMYITEFNTGVFEELTATGPEADRHKTAPGYREWHWENNTTSLFIALANTGALGGSRWGYGTDYWTDPFYHFNSGDSWKAHWYPPLSTDQINNGMNLHFYEDAILTNYIPAFSDVLQVYWEGEDIRVSAFKLEDGNYTFVVQAKETGSDRTIELSLDKAIGKDFNKFVYKNSMSKSGSANIPSLEKTFKSVGNSLVDTIDGEHGTYVYTTCAPVKQIDMPTVAFDAKAGDTVKVEVGFIDCNGDEALEWKVSAATNKNVSASVDSEGNFTVPADANVGDCFAITASLKSDKMIFNTAVVTVVE